jgi:hypothetical protein
MGLVKRPSVSRGNTSATRPDKKYSDAYEAFERKWAGDILKLLRSCETELRGPDAERKDAKMVADAVKIIVRRKYVRESGYDVDDLTPDMREQQRQYAKCMRRMWGGSP